MTGAVCGADPHLTPGVSRPAELNRSTVSSSSSLASLPGRASLVPGNLTARGCLAQVSVLVRRFVLHNRA